MSVSNNTTRFGGILSPFRENNYARSVLGFVHPVICSLANRLPLTPKQQVHEEPTKYWNSDWNQDKMDALGDNFDELAPVAQPKPVIVPKQKLQKTEMICLLTGTLFLATVVFGIVQFAGMDLQTMGLIAHTLKNAGIPTWSPVAITLVTTLAIGFTCAAIENKRRKEEEDSWENDFPDKLY